MREATGATLRSSIWGRFYDSLGNAAGGAAGLDQGAEARLAGLFHLPRRMADGSADGPAAQVRGRRVLGVRGDGEAIVCAGRELRTRGIQHAVRVSPPGERGRAHKRRQARLPDVRRGGRGKACVLGAAACTVRLADDGRGAGGEAAALSLAGVPGRGEERARHMARRSVGGVRLRRDERRALAALAEIHVLDLHSPRLGGAEAVCRHDVRRGSRVLPGGACQHIRRNGVRQLQAGDLHERRDGIPLPGSMDEALAAAQKRRGADGAEREEARGGSHRRGEALSGV